MLAWVETTRCNVRTSARDQGHHCGGAPTSLHTSFVSPKLLNQYHVDAMLDMDFMPTIAVGGVGPLPSTCRQGATRHVI